MTAVDCTPAFGCEPVYQWSLIPIELQGWAFLIFIGIATVAILYGFWNIGGNLKDNVVIDTRDPEKRKLQDKLFVELMGLIMLGMLASVVMMWMGI
jgi:hypothetical protein